jgi:segregation and condensation protein B
VSSQIVKTLLEREWVQVLGHRDTPGRPAMYGTTRQFLDYFNLRSLDQLPSLVELKDIESMNPELEFDTPVPAQTEDTTVPAAAGGDELH